MDSRLVVQKAIEIVGGQTALARLCNVKQQHVWRWLNTVEKLPAEHAIAIEHATSGQITRELLRPDIRWERAEPEDSAA